MGSTRQIGNDPARKSERTIADLSRKRGETAGKVPYLGQFRVVRFREWAILNELPALYRPTILRS